MITVAHQHLEVLVLDNCPIGNENVGLWTKNIHNLRELTVSNCQGITNQATQTICSDCTSLRKLDVGRCQNLTDLGGSAIASLVYLESLSLKDCAGLSSSTIETIIAKKPLKTLNLNYCSTTDKTAYIIGEQLYENLVHLSLQNTATTDDNLLNLFDCEKLQTLNLAATKITGLHLDTFSVFTQLEELSLSETNIYSHEITNKMRIPSLKKLSLNYMFAPLFADTVLHIRQIHTNLQELETNGSEERNQGIRSRFEQPNV